MRRIARRFDQVLEEFRQQEKVQDVLVLTGKGEQADELRRLALAWPKIRITRHPLPYPPGSPPARQLWDWLWDQVEYDPQEVREISGMGAQAEARLAVLRGNRLIYPDGTVSAYVDKCLSSLLRAQLGL
jgi:hypothetical protein